MLSELSQTEEGKNECLLSHVDVVFLLFINGII
jgi:hypothetical protein